MSAKSTTQPQPAAFDGPQKPIIFLLSLDYQSFFDESYASLIDAMVDKATIKRATKPGPAISFLSSTTPQAIFITDPGGVKKANTAVLTRAIAFVRASGIAICDKHFSSFVGPLDMDTFFRTHWGLPWQSSDYHRTTVVLNPRARSIDQRQNGLLSEYSQKVLFLKNVAEDSAWPWPSDESVAESRVFLPTPVDEQQTPVAFAKVGECWLGYLGDVNPEKGSDAVVLAMCGLLDWFLIDPKKEGFCCNSNNYLAASSRCTTDIKTNLNTSALQIDPSTRHQYLGLCDGIYTG